MKVHLILENRKIFEGERFGAEKEVHGEVVFNTSMTGYQEVLTDPSYYGQLVVMTYPLIGNYGINDMDDESDRLWLEGFIVKETSEFPSNFRSKMTLDQYLKKHDTMGLLGIDTRALTKVLRTYGTMRGVVRQAGTYDLEEQIEMIKKYRIIKPVDQVTCTEPLHVEGTGYKIGLMDYGAKRNLVRCLKKRDVDVTVLPANTKADAIMAMGLDGLLLSNGPGDPKHCSEQVDVLKKIKGKLPIFGVCLGHQLFALACGANTVKMKFGHRGGNHPVKDLRKDRTYITSQNHGYAVLAESVTDDGAQISHMNINDQTVEGIRYTNIPAFTVQFHPEAGPGPNDTDYLFDVFLKMVEEYKG